MAKHLAKRVRQNRRLRTIGGRLGGWASRGVIGSLAVVFGVGVAWAVVSDSGIYSVEVADRTGFEEASLDHAIVQYIGDLNTTFGSAGSGVFNAFVRIGGKGIEKGYNTDATGKGLEFDTMAGNFTKSIKVSEIPSIEVGGVVYWEFFSDINESDNTKPISLDELEIFFTDDPKLTGYPFTGKAELVYEFLGTIKINDVNQGSGRGDLRYLVELTDIDIPFDCNYGNTACETYLVLYSVWGGFSSVYASDAGFEEWKVKRYPVLTVTKDIVGEFQTPVTWTIDKGEDGAYAMFAGGASPDHEYSIDVDPVFGDPTNAEISGTITIQGDKSQDVFVSVGDLFEGTPATITGCSVQAVDGKYPVLSKKSITCTYQLAVGTPTAGTNVASASIEIDGTTLIYTGSASIDVEDYVSTGYTGDTSISVTDDNGTVGTGDDHSFGPFTPNDHAPVNYQNSWTCSSEPEDYTDGHYEFSVINSATIDETSDSDTATVDIDCYLPSVSKTAAGRYDERHEWDVEKTVDPLSQSGFAGETVNFDWTITVGETVFEENFSVIGSIKVSNPNPDADLVVPLSDLLDDGTVGVIDQTSCNFDGTDLTVAADDSETCYYSVAPTGKTATENTATITLNGIEISGSDDVEWAANVIRGSATLDDDQFPYTGQPVIDGWTSTYEDSYTCSSDVADYTDGADLDNEVSNTADVSSDGGIVDSSTATTEIDCYRLSVDKTADTTFTRDYDWSIRKGRFIAQGEDDGDGDPSTLTLEIGQTYLASYEVIVTMTGFSDTEHAVAGAITVSNPAPMAAEDVVVTDQLDITGLVDVDCDDETDGNQDTVDIPANSEVECTYETDVADDKAQTNTATATLFGIGYTGSAEVVFGEPTTVLDDCVTVTDDTGTPGDTTDDLDLGTVCLGDLVDGSKTLTYTLDIGPYAECGEFEFINTATFSTSDQDGESDDSGTASYTVAVTVPCGGCTLTQGYWRTHSIYGPAPYDDTWALVGENKSFFHSGQSYYQVLWTSPKGGNAYYILAHQYIAAELNMLTGASVPADVQAAFDAATEWFGDSTHTPAHADGLKGKVGRAERQQLIGWAGLLGSYNEGLVGPGHCDEDGTSVALAMIVPAVGFALFKKGRHLRRRR